MKVVCDGLSSKCIEQIRCIHRDNHEKSDQCFAFCAVLGKSVDCKVVNQEITGNVKVIGEL